MAQAGHPRAHPSNCVDASEARICDAVLFHWQNTAYHDLQHALDVTLAMARLMEG
jgi:hypothetical protein